MWKQFAIWFLIPNGARTFPLKSKEVEACVVVITKTKLKKKKLIKINKIARPMQNMGGSRTHRSQPMKPVKAALSQQYCSENQAIALKTNGSKKKLYACIWICDSVRNRAVIAIVTSDWRKFKSIIEKRGWEWQMPVPKGGKKRNGGSVWKLQIRVV